MRRARTLACAALAVLLAGSALAQAPTNPAAGSSDPTTRLDLLGGEEQRLHWQGRFRDLLDQLDAARVRHAEALAAYSKMRSRRRARGEARRELIEEVDASRQAISDTEAAIETLREEARRAGVPPGWLRLRDTEAPAAPSP